MVKSALNRILNKGLHFGLCPALLINDQHFLLTATGTGKSKYFPVASVDSLTFYSYEWGINYTVFTSAFWFKSHDMHFLKVINYSFRVEIPKSLAWLSLGFFHFQL